MYKISSFTKKTYKIGEVADLLGVTTVTLHNYEKRGLMVFERTQGGKRIITRDNLLEFLDNTKQLEYDDCRIDIMYLRDSAASTRTERETTALLGSQAVCLLRHYSHFKSPLLLNERDFATDKDRSTFMELVKYVVSNQVRRIYTTDRANISADKDTYALFKAICDMFAVRIIIMNENTEEEV